MWLEFPFVAAIAILAFPAERRRRIFARPDSLDVRHRSLIHFKNESKNNNAFSPDLTLHVAAHHR